MVTIGNLEIDGTRQVNKVLSILRSKEVRWKDESLDLNLDKELSREIRRKL